MVSAPPVSAPAGLPESERLLVDAFRGYLLDACPPALVRAHIENPALLDAPSWKGLSAQGWVAAAYPESAGGQGLPFSDVLTIFREAGRAVLRGPFMTSAGLVPLLLQRIAPGVSGSWLSDLASGTAIAGLALDERPLRFPEPSCSAVLSGGRVTGEKAFVREVSNAGHFFVLCRDGVGLAIARITADAAGHASSSWFTLDGSNVGSLVLKDSPAADVFPITPPDLQAFLRQAAVLATALEVGITEATIDFTSAYANERVQFGRLIASFQAVSHRLADMYCRLAIGRALHRRAGRMAEAGAPGWMTDASMAKAYNDDMARFVVNSALQLHGGIGFTFEHDMHLYLRAAQALAGQFGTAQQHRVLLKDAWGLNPAAS